MASPLLSWTMMPRGTVGGGVKGPAEAELVQLLPPPAFLARTPTM